MSLGKTFMPTGSVGSDPAGSVIDLAGARASGGGAPGSVQLLGDPNADRDRERSGDALMEAIGMLTGTPFIGGAQGSPLMRVSARSPRVTGSVRWPVAPQLLGGLPDDASPAVQAARRRRTFVQSLLEHAGGPDGPRVTGLSVGPSRPRSGGADPIFNWFGTPEKPPGPVLPADPQVPQAPESPANDFAPGFDVPDTRRPEI